MAVSRGEIQRAASRSSLDEPPAVSESVPDLRLVLVGKTGAGKSSSGNTILGREAFRAGDEHSSETSECSKQREMVFNRMVYVVDTPGILDTSKPHGDELRREISKCINMSAPGPHAVLLVIKFGPLIKKQRDAVMKVEEIFGKEVWKYTIILFTYGDKVKSGHDEMIKKASSYLQEILKKSGNRYHIFNNLKAGDRQQVKDLLEKVQKMMDGNIGEFFSNDKYKNTVKMLDQREAEIKELYKKKLEEEINTVKTKYEDLLKQTKEEQKMKNQLESELKEVKQRYHSLESGVRQTLERLTRDDEYEKLLKEFPKTLKVS